MTKYAIEYLVTEGTYLIDKERFDTMTEAEIARIKLESILPMTVTRVVPVEAPRELGRLRTSTLREGASEHSEPV